MHRHKLFTDGALLYFAHIFRYVFPIVIIPLLARKLGAEHYGIVLVGLSLATLVSLIVEFGFNVSGTRDLATQDASQLDGVVSAILTAKLILMVPAITFGVAVVSSSTVLQNAPVVGVLSIIYGLLQGTNLLWYFRARGRMALVVKIELAAQLLNMVLIVTFVGGENSYASVILFYILASAERLRIPPTMAAEMVPIDPTMGEFRVHYAGFFDPGFGHTSAAAAPGSRAVLEVRSHEVPFVLEHNQIIGRLVFESMAEEPATLYGATPTYNYQGQGLKLSKHFV